MKTYIQKIVYFINNLYILVPTLQRGNARPGRSSVPSRIPMARTRYRIYSFNHPHFLACTVVNWITLFNGLEVVQIFLDSWSYLQTQNRLRTLERSSLAFPRRSVGTRVHSSFRTNCLRKQTISVCAFLPEKRSIRNPGKYYTAPLSTSAPKYTTYASTLCYTTARSPHNLVTFSFRGMLLSARRCCKVALR